MEGSFSRGKSFRSNLRDSASTDPRDIRTRLLVVEAGGRMVGLLADAAREFITIPETAVQPPGASISGLSSNYLEGIATLGDRLVLILNVQDVIASAPAAA